MNKNLGYYIGKFTKLRVDRATGNPAPHKPVLLLSVIALIEQNIIHRNRFYLTPELIAKFLESWTDLDITSHRSDISLPFFHLRGDSFWHLTPNPGYEAVIHSKSKIKGLKAVRNAVQYAFLDDELFELLQDQDARAILVHTLIENWFSGKTVQVDGLLKVDSLQKLQLVLREKGGEVYDTSILEDEQKLIVRDAAFRRLVTQIYEHRCALCRLKIFDNKSQTIVDGAHIKPFAEFRDDRIDNGLSLCKNHHWAFDRGWFSVDDSYNVIVSNDLHEDSPNAKEVKEFQEERILLPSNSDYFPRTEALAWHRENVFNEGQPPILYY
ncbi:MAG: HNH endonuclease [Microcoleaceae cyanobacterium]